MQKSMMVLQSGSVIELSAMFVDTIIFGLEFLAKSCSPAVCEYCEWSSMT